MHKFVFSYDYQNVSLIPHSVYFVNIWSWFIHFSLSSTINISTSQPYFGYNWGYCNILLSVLWFEWRKPHVFTFYACLQFTYYSIYITIYIMCNGIKQNVFLSWNYINSILLLILKGILWISIYSRHIDGFVSFHLFNNDNYITLWPCISLKHVFLFLFFAKTKSLNQTVTFHLPLFQFKQLFLPSATAEFDVD